MGVVDELQHSIEVMRPEDRQSVILCIDEVVNCENTRDHGARDDPKRSELAQPCGGFGCCFSVHSLDAIGGGVRHLGFDRQDSTVPQARDDIRLRAAKRTLIAELARGRGLE